MSSADRRRCLATFAASAAVAPFAGLVLAGRPAVAAARTEPEPEPADAPPRLAPEPSRRFRDWMTLLVRAQLERGPTPRWTQRDCAGLVRFCAAEALRAHDIAWRRANGLLGERLPPDVGLAAADEAELRHAWLRSDGSRGAFAGALDLVQGNTRCVGRAWAEALPADLLFYDFGDDQHLMICMGAYIAYHTGRVDPGDNGLRALRPAQLLGWRDTRWRPERGNPNFAGVFRLGFLA